MDQGKETTMTFQIAMRGLALALGMAVAADVGHAQPAPPYEGLKQTVSVDQFQVSDLTGGAGTADGMTTLLTNALIKDGRFVVVDRSAMASISAEQALGQTGAATAETSARVGQLIGASAIVRGVVTKFQPAASGGGVTIGGFPMGIGSLLGAGAGVKSQTAMMEISLRLIDTTTGQVISTSTAQGSASTTSVDVTAVNPNTGLSVGGGVFQSTPIGQAGEQAIVKAVELIASGMRSIPWSALVIDARDGTVFVNAGAERNVQIGLTLNVYRKGRVFTDPATGVVLDVEFEKIGTLRVVGVREKMSTAVVESGEIPVRGNLLRQKQL
jgi:curli biogenesis system outer membrane secretion channel CsgG